MPYKRKRGIIMEKKKHPGKIIGLIAGGVVLLIVIIVIATSFMGGSDDMQGSSLDQETINKVREFAPSDAKGITYNQAFAGFYSNPDWKSFKSDAGEDIVEFSGGCSYNDIEGTFYIQFHLDSTGSINGSYMQFTADGEDTAQKVPDEDRIYFIAKPFVEYGNANGKTFTEEEQNALCSSDSDDSSSEE